MIFKLFLLIQELENLPPDRSKSSFVISVEWRGRERKGGVGFMLQRKKRNVTSKQPAQQNGTVAWNERFNCTCKLKRMNSQSYKSWAINLEVHEFGANPTDDFSVIVGKTEINVADYAPPNGQKRIRIPIRFSLNDQPTAETELKVKLRFVELGTNGAMAFALPRTLRFHKAFSCVVGLEEENLNSEFSAHRSIYPSLADSSSSEDEPDHEVKYKQIAATNILFHGEVGDDHETVVQYVQRSPDRVKRQPSLARLLSSKSKLGFKSIKHLKGEPLLNKLCSDVGGDDIDIERHQHAGTAVDRGGFEDEGVFEVGVWERRSFVSRDGELELLTDVLLASIDQRSEKAAGGGACTVLAVVIADWLHRNPRTLPLRCQLDELIHQGSSQWRKLCEVQAHKERFSDQHFDLDTVLAAEVRALAEVKSLSYVGFFGLEETPESLHSLQETMSLDGIWNELRHATAAEERIYIASWNDHFFVLKVEQDAIFLIDTLGERLFEGCHQAFVLRFHHGSAIYKRRGDGCRPEDAPGDEDGDAEQGKGKSGSSNEVVCDGIDCCKEYMRRFLAALPLRELQEDVKRGVMEEAILHRRLQIEFHYTAPASSQVLSL